MDLSRILVCITAGLVLATLAACGGGGGGGGSGGGTSAVVYSGNSSAAAVTTTNASTITANVVGSDDASAIIGGISVESSNVTQNQGTGPAELARRLSQGFREVVSRTNLKGSTQQVVTAGFIDDTQPCDLGNGTVRIFGTVDDITLTGTVTIVFSNCLIAGVTLNGTGTMRIDVFLTDVTMSFARLTLRGTGLSVDAGGSIHFVEFGNTLTITMNLVEINNNTGKMRKSVDLIIVEVYDNPVSPTTFTQTLTGQVFHSDYGFVTVNTLSAFVFGPPIQLFPVSGQMTLTGAPEGVGNRAIRVTALTSPPAALPATLVRLELDLDGDGAFEINDVRLKWTELTGPVGADLGDTDGDLMHNSWETANAPMDPNNVLDAALNNDGDAFTNLQEYMAGTNPNVANP